MNLFHDSRDLVYRSPFGAVKTGTRIRLAVRAEGAQEVTLRCWQDDLGVILCPMKRKDGDMFSAEITAPDHGCLVWYFFIARDAEGNSQFYGNALDRLGGEGRAYDFEPPSFQITVFKQAYVPAWYKNAIVYQIFPDRFARGEERNADLSAVPLRNKNGAGQRLMKDWYATPSYDKNAEGEITVWDIYGGSLKGIKEKLSYLRSLGIGALYLNPVFEAASNHRYDTADYLHIDPALGTDEDFEDLCIEAATHGIRIILDGVFNHSGRDSRYFDYYGNYGNQGAWNNEDSPYRSWYCFKNEDPGYESWWGVKDLPNFNEDDPSFRSFICGNNGVIQRWIEAGASGFRLDVADELPDSFICDIRHAIKDRDPNALLLGEVWEDASNKESHGEKRRYFMGDELDGVMNYPLRTMLLDFAHGYTSSSILVRQLLCLKENYPPENFYACLNLLGSHDRTRLLTELGAQEDPAKAKAAEKMLSALVYACPGVPCIYYGDEAGLTGGTDPENRAAYPWGREDHDLLAWYKMLGKLYHAHSALKNGSLRMLNLPEDVFGFVRENRTERILVLANRHHDKAQRIRVRVDASKIEELFSRRSFTPKGPFVDIKLPPLTCCWILLKETAL